MNGFVSGPFSSSPHPARLRYPIAVLCILIAVAVRVLLQEIVARAMFITFYPAVILAALYGGFLAGLLAATLSALVVALWRQPLGEPLMQTAGDWLSIVFFLVTSVLVCWIAERLRRSQARAAAGEAKALQAGERAGTEEALRESEAKYRIVAENTYAWEFWLSPEEKFLYNSPSCERITGYLPEEFDADPDLLYRIIHPDDLAHYQEHRGGGEHQFCVTETTEFRIVRRDGAVRWIAHACQPIYDEKSVFLGVRGSNRDVTKEKQAEEALRESEERYRALITASAHVLYRMNPDWSEIRQLQGGGFIADTAWPTVDWLKEYIPPDDQALVIEAIGKAVSSGCIFELEHRVWRTDGGIGWTLSRAVPLRNAAGEVVEWFGAATDITERKQAEEALSESETRFRALFENMQDGVAYCQMVFDEEGRPQDFIYLSVNSAFGRLTGLANVIGKRVSEVLPGIRDMHPELLETYGRVARTGQPERLEIEFKPLAMWLSLAVYSPQPGRFAAVFQNITARKAAEEALHLAKEELEQRVQERTAELWKRTEQLRLLASEMILIEQRERSRLALVLHDGLQQVLVASRMRLAGLGRAEYPAVRQRGAEVSELLKESIEISRSLTAELSPPILHEGGLIPALEWLARWMQDKQGLTVHLDGCDPFEAVAEDRLILLFQATRELLFNVVKHAGVKSADVRVQERDGFLEIAVADEGAGFDPVKPATSATHGLGLFSIRERLDIMGGRLEIRSAPGQGSTFTLQAPLTALAAPPLAARNQS